MLSVKRPLGLKGRAIIIPGAGLLLTLLGTSIACSGGPIQFTPTPRVVDLATLPVSVNNTTPSRTPLTGMGPTATPTPTPYIPTAETAFTPPPTPINSPTPSPAPLSLSLNLLAPAEGAGVEVGAVRVLGVTAPDAGVTINGAQAHVAADGTFQRDLTLQEGINSIVARAESPSGAVATDNVLVLFVPRPEGVPLSVLFPQGLEVSTPEITIIGATRQDAVIGVNGVPVDVNSLGIFSEDVSLEEGANLIEVVAVDLEENVNFQTVVVFYIP